MAEPISLAPIEGWGFAETVDGKLASPFQAQIQQEAAEFGSEVVGWTAKAPDGKYAGAQLRLTPRNTPFNGVVVLHVSDSKTDKELYSGFADSQGLEPSWKN